MKTGIFAGISNEEYHTGEGVSKSGLDLIHDQSPLHYWSKYLDPNREPRKETPALKLGQALHTAILEPEEFDNRYVLVPDGAPRRPSITQINAKKPSDDTLYAIGWWDDFNAKNEGKVILDAGDSDMVKKVSTNARNHPLAKNILSVGVAEQSVFWTDPETGVLCKCRPDWLIDPNPNCAVLDLKSALDASPEGFRRSAYNYGYHRAAAWYLDGVEAATGERPDAFMFLAVEKEPPYAVAYYYADEAMIELGRRECRAALRTYAECLSSGKWPGYADRLLPLGLPRWAEVRLDGDGQ
jgi:exodeoxyribonuclease VIII